jgi:hypothetical protein
MKLTEKYLVVLMFLAYVHINIFYGVPQSIITPLDKSKNLLKGYVE